MPRRHLRARWYHGVMVTKSKKPKLYPFRGTCALCGGEVHDFRPHRKVRRKLSPGISLSAVPPTGKPTGGTNKRTPPLRPCSPTGAPGRALIGAAAPTSSSRGAGPGGPRSTALASAARRRPRRAGDAAQWRSRWNG